MLRRSGRRRVARWGWLQQRPGTATGIAARVGRSQTSRDTSCWCVTPLPCATDCEQADAEAPPSTYTQVRHGQYVEGGRQDATMVLTELGRRQVIVHAAGLACFRCILGILDPGRSLSLNLLATAGAICACPGRANRAEIGALPPRKCGVEKYPSERHDSGKGNC